FFTEIFNKTTPHGNFLQIDSSVFNIFTSNDPALPRELVIDRDGRDKFRKYVPYDRSFVNTIEDYPYPYVIGKLCWEFPCVTPSDWEAQHLHESNNPVTVADWKAALDATVIKQGVFCLVFHPHGWIKNEQIVDLIDHAMAKHGKKVKFLTFKEALERLNKSLLNESSLRDDLGPDNGLRLLDLNNDGYMDVVATPRRETHLWSPTTNNWLRSHLPCKIVSQFTNFEKEEKEERISLDAGARFGIFHSDGSASLLAIERLGDAAGWEISGCWHFEGE